MFPQVSQPMSAQTVSQDIQRGTNVVREEWIVLSYSAEFESGMHANAPPVIKSSLLSSSHPSNHQLVPRIIKSSLVSSSRPSCHQIIPPSIKSSLLSSSRLGNRGTRRKPISKTSLETCQEVETHPHIHLSPSPEKKKKKARRVLGVCSHSSTRLLFPDFSIRDAFKSCRGGWEQNGHAPVPQSTSSLARCGRSRTCSNSSPRWPQPSRAY